MSLTASSKQTQEKLCKSELRQFSGDMIRYVHPLNRKVNYTPGIRYVAEQGKAYWLLDAIASYFGSPIMQEAMAKDYRVKSMQFWRLVAKDESAVLTAEADAGVEPFITQEIPFTDFPLDQIDIWAGFDGSFWTLYLPSEH